MTKYYSLNKKKKQTPYKWLRDLTSPIDIGKLKVKDGEKYSPHLNTIKDVLAAYNRGQWWRIETLCNKDYDDHFASHETYYFTAGRGERVLVMIDVDCKRCGTLAGAMAYCKFLSESFLPGLYYEPSTNGNGAHGYIIVETSGLKGDALNDLLLHRLAPHLNTLAEGFDIEFVEVKGTMPHFGWGEAKGELRTFRCGCLAKLPRDVSRFKEWQRTAVISEWDLRKLPVGGGPNAVKKKERKATSCSGKLIGDDEINLTSTSYRQVAEQIMGGKSLNTSGKHVATPEDMAILLCLGKFCTDHMNEDGTLPFERIKGLWTALREAGDVDRPFCGKRYGAMRDRLSDLGLIDWEDNTYVVGVRACKWRFSPELMDMLPGKGEEEASLRGTVALGGRENILGRHSCRVTPEEQIEWGEGSILGRHSCLETTDLCPQTPDFLRPEQVIPTFDYLLADKMVDQIITDWGELALAC